MKLGDILYIAGAIVFSLGGGAALVIALSSWLGKLWAQRIIQSEAAEHQRLTHQHNIRFSNIHATQAELIAKLYALLHKLRQGVRLLRDSANDDWLGKAEDYGWDLRGSASEAEKFYDTNCIYFSEELSNRMADFIATCDEASNVYLSAHYCEIADEKDAKMKQARILLLNAHEKTEKAMEQMVHDFRGLLGVPK